MAADTAATRLPDDPAATSPSIVVAAYRTANGTTVRVVRDDRLFAGTKQRAACTFVAQLLRARETSGGAAGPAAEATAAPSALQSQEPAAGPAVPEPSTSLAPPVPEPSAVPAPAADSARPPIKHLLYTAPYNGFGPVAVAHCAQMLGLHCTLVLTRRPISSSRSVPLDVAIQSETVRRAKACGARVLFADTWDEMRKRGFDLLNTVQPAGSVLWVPIGLSRPAFVDVLTDKIAAAAAGCTAAVSSWKRIFVAGGTGALGLALSRVFPHAQICIVPAAIDSEGLKRIEKTVGPALLASGRIVVLPHHTQAATLPPTPYPSVPGYDEIVWSRVVEDARDGDVVWNVAGFTVVPQGDIAAGADSAPVSAEAGGRKRPRSDNDGDGGNADGGPGSP